MWQIRIFKTRTWRYRADGWPGGPLMFFRAIQWLRDIPNIVFVSRGHCFSRKIHI